MKAAFPERADVTGGALARSARPAMPVAPTTARGPASVLALQRAAGNAATGAVLRGDTRRTRTLARCAGACTCGGGCHANEPDGDELADERTRLMRAATESVGTELLARSVRERQGGQPLPNRMLQRMAPCPPRLGASDAPPPGWKPYFGDSRVFHCGFRGILEDRAPTRDDPMNECFYDNSGTLVDDTHPNAACGGSPDEYDASEAPIRHALIDKGGIVRAGLPAFLESMKHAAKSKAQSANSWYGRAKARWLYGAP